MPSKSGVKCKYCGEQGLTWAKGDRGYVLVPLGKENEPETWRYRHKCDEWDEAHGQKQAV